MVQCRDNEFVRAFARFKTNIVLSRISRQYFRLQELNKAKTRLTFRVKLVMALKLEICNLNGMDIKIRNELGFFRFTS